MMTAALSIVAAIWVSAFVIFVALNLSLGSRQIDAPLSKLYSVRDPQFLRAICAVVIPAIEPGNRVRELLNGDEIFGAMLHAVQAAESTINFETYIYWSGSIGAEFSNAFAAAARRGVEVKIVLDWVGGDLDRAQLRKMRHAGVDIRRYNPLRWANLGHLNNRTHRKLLVVDAKVGFIGGVGIADCWRGNAEDCHHWRDTHFQVEGPAVGQMQSAFIDNWVQTTGTLLHDARYLPRPEFAGSQQAQIFTSAPRSGAKSMQLLYLMSITAADESLDIAASYFVPDSITVASLVAAAKRGVRTRIILPGRHIDRPLVRRAARATLGPLLVNGVQIFEYQPTMFHCKVLIVDQTWVSVGSTNIDSRSFRINDEANMNVYDRGFARRQTEVFEADLTKCERITAAAWSRRTWHERALDWSAALLSSQL